MLHSCYTAGHCLLSINTMCFPFTWQLCLAIRSPEISSMIFKSWSLTAKPSTCHLESYPLLVC